MGIKEQGFGEGVSLAQRALNQSLQIGQKFEQTGSEIDNYLDSENLQNQTVEIRTQLKDIHTAVDGNIDAFKKASEETFNNIAKNSRNSKIQAKLEREFNLQQSSYLNQMELATREEIKNTNLVKTAQVMQSNNEEMAKSINNGDIDRTSELYQDNLSFLKASYDNGDLTETEYRLRLQREENNATQTRLQTSFQNNYDMVNEAIKDEQLKSIEEVMQFNEGILDVLKNPQNHKELWKSRGYRVEGDNIIDEVTGKEITVNQRKELEQQAEINGKKLLNNFQQKNQELLNESKQNTLFIEKSLKEGKTYSNEQLTAIEERDAQIIGVDRASKKWQEIKDLNMFLKNSSPKERNEILKSEDFFKNDPMRKALYKSYSDINAASEIKDPMQYAVDNELTTTPEISIEQSIEEFKANIISRANESEKIGKERGVKYEIMTNKEMNKFAEGFDKLPAESQYLYQTVLYDNITSKQLNQLATKMYKDNPNSSFIRGIDLQNRFANNKELALTVLGIKSQGAEILEKVPDFYSKKHSEDFDTQLSIQTQGYYDSETIIKRPNDFSSIREIYTAELANAGLNGGEDEVNQDILEKSINLFYSKTLEFEINDIKYKIQTPNASVSPEEMQDRIDGLTPSQLTIYSELPEGFDKQETIEKIQDGDYRLRGIQIAQETDIVYELVQSDGRVLADKNGKHFILTLSNTNNTKFEDLSQEQKEINERVEFYNQFGTPKERQTAGESFDKLVGEPLLDAFGFVAEKFEKLNLLKDNSITLGKNIFKVLDENLKPETVKKQEAKLKQQFSNLNNLLNELQEYKDTTVYNEEHLEATKTRYNDLIRRIKEEETKLKISHSRSIIKTLPFEELIPDDMIDLYKEYKGE